MRGSRVSSARLTAGAFLFAVAAIAAADRRIEIVAPRTDGSCPEHGPPWGVRSAEAAAGSSASSRSCARAFRPADLSDATLEAASSALAGASEIPALLIDLSRVPGSADGDRLSYAIKKVASAARSQSPNVRIGLDVSSDQATALGPTFFTETRPYWDAVVWRAGRGPVAIGEDIAPYWLVVSGLDGADPVSAAVGAISGVPKPFSLDVLWIETPVSSGSEALGRLQKYFVEDSSIETTESRAAAADGRPVPIAASFDPKALTPLLFLPEDRSGSARIELAGGPFARASVENLATGARRDFDLAGSNALALDLSKGPLAVVLRPAARTAGEARAEVDVGAARGLTADEIVAKERAWDAGQRERLQTFTAEMKTSLRFRVADVNETFDLTIQGPFFSRRDAAPDWVWRDFYLNGVKWKGRTLPRLPILQPEKVTTLPLDIRLTEDYAYVLKGTSRVAGRSAYEIAYTPKTAAGDRPIYHGTVWIDRATFALLRRVSIQENLKGETLSNVQDETYRPVPGHADVYLPLHIKGQQVFSTAGRTTAIERDVTMTGVEVNPGDFDARLSQAYASPMQMIRDTDRGLRYLVPDPAKPGERIVEEGFSKKSTFGLIGTFYDASLSYPIPLLGVQHFNFDLWGKGKQLSIFFGGALLSANYTDPSLLRSRFDLGADLFAVAFPFEDVSYRNGREVSAEKVKHLSEFTQINVGRPFGPYLKASVGIFGKWDDYQRDKDTGPDFIVPVDTMTYGTELRLVGNFKGFSATLLGSFATRASWQFWGVPGQSEFKPSQKEFWKYSLTVSKDEYFSGFRKLHVSAAYLGGDDLDRFSKYEFGTFSPNPIHGYKSGSLRTENAWLLNLSYGLNIENIIRFEGFYDQALLKDTVSGFDHKYFSGAGLLASLNGPWQNSLVRGEIGVPVVSHGIHGVVVNFILLKLF